MSATERSGRTSTKEAAAEGDHATIDPDQADAPEVRGQAGDRIGPREPGFFRWAWARIATEIPDLHPGQANPVIEGEAHTQRVIARLIVDRRGLDVQAPGEDPVEAIENLVRALHRAICQRDGAHRNGLWASRQVVATAAPLRLRVGTEQKRRLGASPSDLRPIQRVGSCLPAPCRAAP